MKQLCKLIFYFEIQNRESEWVSDMGFTTHKHKGHIAPKTQWKNMFIMR